MIAEQLQTKLFNGIDILGEAVEEQRRAAIEKATAEHTYRQAQAVAYLNVMGQADAKKPTEAHIRAMVDRQCNEEMHRMRMAEAGLEAATQRLISLRSEISALQSMLNAFRAEAALHTYQGHFMG